MIKTLYGKRDSLFGYIKPLVKDLVVENLSTKLNLYVSIKLSKYDKNNRKMIRPHILSQKKSVEIPAENWFNKQYNKVQRELTNKFVELITDESGWSLEEIEFTDVALQRYDTMSGLAWSPLPQ